MRLPKGKPRTRLDPPMDPLDSSATKPPPRPDGGGTAASPASFPSAAAIAASAPPPSPRALLDDSSTPLERILTLRICDLRLSIEGTPVEGHVKALLAELDGRGIAWRPTFYLTDEWGCPDRIPAIGIPFYLAHPRLLRIERHFFTEAEGENPEAAMRLLRHEAGHAINYAYRLYRTPSWRERFGRYSTPYEDEYRTIPGSTRFVRHLADDYAQRHPDEDFAETFAVWLTPGLDWRKEYGGLPALEKLHYVDETVAKVGKAPPLVRVEGVLGDACSKLRRTLGSHYRRRIDATWHERPESLDSDLRRLFGDRLGAEGSESAAKFLRGQRTILVERLTTWAGVRKYRARAAVETLTQRSRELRLALRPEDYGETLLNLTALLARMVVNQRHTGRYLSRRSP